MRTAREKVKKQREARADPVTEEPKPKRKFDEIDLEVKPLLTTRPPRPIWTEHKGYPHLVLTKPSAEMRGHTSYLTFASYYPRDIREQLQQTKPIPSRIATLREGSTDTTEYGSEGLDEVMGTLTEDEILALGV